MTSLKNQNKLFYTGIGLCAGPFCVSIIEMVSCKKCISINNKFKGHIFPFIYLNNQYLLNLINTLIDSKNLSGFSYSKLERTYFFCNSGILHITGLLLSIYSYKKT